MPEKNVEMQTYVKRKEAGIIIDIHGVVNAMNIWIEIARERTMLWIALCSKRSRVSKSRIRHIVGTSITT
jgi:hypothetical protein